MPWRVSGLRAVGGPWAPEPLDDVPLDVECAAMPDSFDGAGDPYRGSSYRGWMMVAIVIVVAVAVLWIAYGEALDVLPSSMAPA